MEYAKLWLSVGAEISDKSFFTLFFLYFFCIFWIFYSEHYKDHKSFTYKRITYSYLIYYPDICIQNIFHVGERIEKLCIKFQGLVPFTFSNVLINVISITVHTIPLNSPTNLLMKNSKMQLEHIYSEMFYFFFFTHFLLLFLERKKYVGLSYD